eukprot:COSAG01_NODE_486_length_16379_cov_28.208717_11_plen_60_part_00
MMNTLFSVAGNPGIKIVDTSVMLGVHRTTLVNNGQLDILVLYCYVPLHQTESEPPGSPT